MLAINDLCYPTIVEVVEVPLNIAAAKWPPPSIIIAHWFWDGNLSIACNTSISSESGFCKNVPM